MKANLLLHACIALVVIGLCSKAATGDEFDQAIRRGDQLRGRQQFVKALDSFARARDLAANDLRRSIAIAKRAEVLAFDLNKFDEARAEASKAVTLAGSHAFPHAICLLTLARCEMHGDRDFQSAVKSIQRLRKLPNVDWAQPAALLMLGDCLRELGSHEEAIKAYREVLRTKAAATGNKAHALLNIGLIHQYQDGDLAAARKQYDKAVALNPGIRPEIEKHLAASAHKAGRRRGGERPLILAHYMPWFASKPHSGKWGWHWTMNHFNPDKKSNGKQELASQYSPLIGGTIRVILMSWNAISC